MYGIISSSEYIYDIRHAVQDNSIWFEEYGEFSSDTFLIHCHSAAKANVQTIIIDMTCVDDASIIRGIQQFRLLRDSRIVIIAPGRVPGDSTITTLLGLQVLDIVAPIIDMDSEDVERPSIAPLIKAQLALKPSYGNAVRWDVKTDEAANLKELQSLKKNFSKEKEKGKERVTTSGPEQTLLDHIHSDPTIIEYISNIDLPPPPKSVVKEVVVYKDRMVGTPVIAVGGVDRRTGTTWAALHIARFLASRGFKTVCLELNDTLCSPNVFRFIDFQESKHTPGGYHIDGVDLFSNDRLISVDRIISEYEYAVLDLGQLVNDNKLNDGIEHFVRANIQIVTAGSSDWDFDRLTAAISLFQSRDISKKLNILINLASEQRFNEINKLFSKQEKEEYKLSFYQAPYIPNDTTIDLSTEELLTMIMAEFLPVQKQKRSWNLWKRRN